MIQFHLRQGPKVVSFTQVFKLKSYRNFLSALFILHVFNLVLPNIMTVMAHSEDHKHEAPLYIISVSCLTSSPRGPNILLSTISFRTPTIPVLLCV